MSDSYSYGFRSGASSAHGSRAAVKHRAIAPQRRWCRITKQEVVIHIEYLDYVNQHCKGPEGNIYCENIISCYQKNVKCRYSGISPLYPNPFEGPLDDNGTENENGREPASESIKPA